MNDSSDQAALLLRAVAATQDRLRTFAHELQARPDVLRVTREFDCYGHSDDFPTGAMGVLDWWVEAEYHDDTSRCYSLSVYYDGREWDISTRITEPASDGPVPVTELADRRASDIPGCVGELERALHDLFEVARREREEASRLRPHN